MSVSIKSFFLVSQGESPDDVSRRLDLSDVVRPRVTEMPRQREAEGLCPPSSWSEA